MHILRSVLTEHRPDPHCLHGHERAGSVQPLHLTGQDGSVVINTTGPPALMHFRAAGLFHPADAATVSACALTLQGPGGSGLQAGHASAGNARPEHARGRQQSRGWLWHWGCRRGGRCCGAMALACGESGFDGQISKLVSDKQQCKQGSMEGKNGGICAAKCDRGLIFGQGQGFLYNFVR